MPALDDQFAAMSDEEVADYVQHWLAARAGYRAAAGKGFDAWWCGKLASAGLGELERRRRRAPSDPPNPPPPDPRG